MIIFHAFMTVLDYLYIASYHRPHARNGVAHSGFQSHHSVVEMVSLCSPGLLGSQRAQEHHAAAPWRPLAAVRNRLKMTRNGLIFTILAPPRTLALGGMAAHSEAYKTTIRRAAYITIVTLRFRATRCAQHAAMTDFHAFVATYI
jgi:hypothetical protein